MVRYAQDRGPDRAKLEKLGKKDAVDGIVRCDGHNTNLSTLRTTVAWIWGIRQQERITPEILNWVLEDSQIVTYGLGKV